MEYASKDIRNILVAGHAGCGKTTLVEALLYQSGATERMGRVEDGTTASDFDPEEVKRKASLNSSVVPVEIGGTKFNLIDAPGLFDFETGACEGVEAAESVLICVSGRSGVSVGAEKAYNLAVKHNKARLVFVTKTDLENADYFKILEQMKIKFGPSVCPCVVPVRLVLRSAPASCPCAWTTAPSPTSTCSARRLLNMKAVSRSRSTCPTSATGSRV